MFAKRSYEDILNFLLKKLTEETDISLTTPGGVARTLMEISSKELATNFNIFDYNFMQGFVSTASGSALDKFGLLFGLTRKSVDPSINAEAKVVYFYLNDSGPEHEKGAPNLAAAVTITIPANTYISTNELSSIDNPIVWRTRETVTIAPGYYLGYATVEPVNGGDITVGPGGMINHSLDVALFPNIYVYNKNSLVSRPEYESDDNYRYRIINGLRYLAAGNAIAYRIALLSIPGVRDVRITPLKYGIGTIEVLVVPEKPGTDDAINALSLAISAVDSIKSVGDIPFVKLTTEIKVDINAVLTLDRSKVTNYNTTMIFNNAANEIRKHINSLGVGENLTVSSIVGVAIGASPLITDCTILSSGGIIVDGVAHDLSPITAGDVEQIYAGTITVR